MMMVPRVARREGHSQINTTTQSNSCHCSLFFQDNDDGDDDDDDVGPPEERGTVEQVKC